MVISPIGRLWSNLTVEIPWNLRTEDLYIKTREQSYYHKMNQSLCYFTKLRIKIFNFWKKHQSVILPKISIARIDIYDIFERYKLKFLIFRKSIKREVSVKLYQQHSPQDECKNEMVTKMNRYLCSFSKNELKFLIFERKHQNHTAQ